MEKREGALFLSLLDMGSVMLEKVGKRTYKYIAQVEYDPYNDVIQKVKD